ncbi:hypothetical protein [Melittangium boletus]|uniref:hypothetical protein n=1 Tax=Melittangium boletus TaxID=83453 RepID=UPI003DA3021D
MAHIFGQLALALLATGTVTAPPALDEQGAEDAMETAAAATNICSSSPTPAGWVDIQWYYSAGCGTGSFAPNTKRIQQISGEPIGATVNACNTTPVPAGWSQIDYYYSSNCQSGSVGSLNPNTRMLKRVY